MSEDIVVTSQGGSWAMVHVWVLGLEHDGSPLSGADLRTYIALRSYANRAGDCYPKLKTIAERAHTSLASAKRAIAKFADLGLVEIAHQHRADGSLMASRYHLADVSPVEQDRKEEDDWRDADRALFVELMGSDLRYEGTHYRPGLYSSRVWYEEFRTRNVGKRGTKFRWPGKFVLSLDQRDLDRWMEEEGISEA